MGKAESSFFLFPRFFVEVQSPLSPHRLWGRLKRGSSRSTHSFSFSFSSPSHNCIAAGGGLRDFVDIDKSPSEILEARKPQKSGLCSQTPALPPNSSSPDTHTHTLTAPPPPRPAPGQFAGFSLGILTRFGDLLPRCFQRPSPWSENVQWSC